MPRALFQSSSSLVRGLLLAATSLFTVTEAQLAIRTEFGAIVGTRLLAGPALQVAVGPGRQVRAAHPVAVVYRRDLPHQRQSRPHRRLLRQVAGQGRFAVLPGNRRPRGPGGRAHRRDREGRHQERGRAAHAGTDRIGRARRRDRRHVQPGQPERRRSRHRADRRARSAHRSAGRREHRASTRA